MITNLGNNRPEASHLNCSKNLWRRKFKPIYVAGRILKEKMANNYLPFNSLSILY